MSSMEDSDLRERLQLVTEERDRLKLELAEAIDLRDEIRKLAVLFQTAKGPAPARDAWLAWQREQGGGEPPPT